MEQKILLIGKSINETRAGLDERSNLDYAANAFIRAYIDEVSRIKKRGTRKQKIAYLFRKKKDVTFKDVYALVNGCLYKTIK